MRNKLISLGLAAGFLGGAALLMVPASAWAQVQDKAQQGCINQLNKGGAKVAATQGKENSGCVKNAGKGKLTTATAEDCLTADSKNKVGKATGKNTDGETKKCSTAPDFGATDAATGNAAAVAEEINLLHDIYGPDLDAAIIDAGTDKVGAGCQAAIVKTYEKLAATKIKQFLGCKKSGLGGKTTPQIASAADLAGCLEGRSDSIKGDPKGKVQKARDKLVATVSSKCGGVPDTAFPGSCTLSSGFAQCVDERVECRVCLLLDAMDNLGADCDTFDDGVANGSCPPVPSSVCGDGQKTGAELCDPTAPSPDNECLEGRPGSTLRTCNSDCTCTCPTRVEWEGNGDLADLDTGWTGQSHDAKVVRGGVVTFGINCGSSTRPCGQCTVSGPLENDPSTPSPLSGGPKANNHRCVVDTSIECSADSDCPVGTCEFYYGSYLPLSAGGVSTCVENQIDGPLSGTVNVEDGTGDVGINLIARVFNGILVAQPCPICVGDVTPGDGVRDGICSGGSKDGTGSCDVSGVHPFVNSFGATSFDCPPSSGGKIAELSIDLRSVTGTISRNITTASPSCTAPGWGTMKCMSDTCSEPGAPACFTDAGCSSGTCGGKRCIGGSNDGSPCAANSDCASGVCSRPGQATQVNSCLGGATDCLPDSVFDEGFCASGPFDSLCTIETFRGCAADSDCPAPGDSCAGGKLRDCFTTDGTTTGDTDVFAIGAGCGPHLDDLCNATAASLFAIGPTTAPAVNSVAGLPGLGRLTLPGVAGGLP